MPFPTRLLQAMSLLRKISSARFLPGLEKQRGPSLEAWLGQNGSHGFPVQRVGSGQLLGHTFLLYSILKVCFNGLNGYNFYPFMTNKKVNGNKDPQSDVPWFSIVIVNGHIFHIPFIGIRARLSSSIFDLQAYTPVLETVSVTFLPYQ